MNTIQQLNKDMFSDIKRSKTGRSHGLDVFIQAIEEAQERAEEIGCSGTHQHDKD